MVTIKQFIEWIIKTYNILIPYDKTFDYGNEYIERGLCGAQKTRLVDKSTRGLAYFYITQFLIINLYELLNLIHRWKFPQNDPNAVLSDKQFINKLQKKENWL